MLKNSPGGTVYLLKRAELATRNCVEAALAQFALTPTQFLILLRLKLEDGMSSAGLARAAGVRPQSVMEIVAPLERSRLISRQVSPEHRRVLQISLTSKGQRVLTQSLQVARQLEAELLAGVTRPELRTFQSVLEKLLSHAESHDLHPAMRAMAARPASSPRGRAKRVAQSVVRGRRTAS